MAATVSESDDTELIRRMNSIRNASEQHVAQLHHEVERLKDWREHVRAQPILALGASAVVGFWLVSKFTAPKASRKKVSRKKLDEKAVTEVAATTSLAAGAMALLGSLASNGIRMAATHYLRSALEKREHY